MDDVRGINIEAIPRIKNKITKYQTAIKNVKIGITKTKIEANLRGKVSQAKLKEYIEEIEKKIDKYVDEFENVKTSLDEVVAAYEADDSNTSGVFAGAISNLLGPTGDTAGDAAGTEKVAS